MNFKNNKRISLITDFILCVLLIALDQVTKYFAVRYLKDKPAIVLAEGIFELRYLDT